MGQLWTDAMQADLDRWQVSADKAAATSTTATGLDTPHVRDVLRGLATYCVAVIRHKFLRGAEPLWSLAEEIDYAGFLRRLDAPLDPEHAAVKQDGEVDFFKNDPWCDMELPRA
jgi:hypothetical protein